MLTEKEIQFFEENGYVGPFDLSRASAVEPVKRLIDDELLDRVSPIYGTVSPRDWHLASRALYEVCTDPAIVERLAGVLGPDILLWRSQMFYKKPGDGVTAWHQDYNFPGPFKVPSIDPPVTVTAWIALDEATIENGCVELVAGSHKEGRIGTVRTSGGEGIFGRDYGLDREIGGADTIAKMTIRPGQFFLFSNLTVHGSGPNLSETTRLGIGVRFTSTDVRVYPDLSIDGQGMSLDNYGCVLVRGEDRFGHNRMREAPASEIEEGGGAGETPEAAAFKAGYRLGFTKGRRHAERGIRIEIGERAERLRSSLGSSKGYGGAAAHPEELKAGLVAGYADGVENRPFDTRYGSPSDATGLPGGRLPGPIRRVLRRVVRLAKGR
jgi:non-heme Fe2+,alpha-ketoglutarate-dependent halogenase